VVHCDANQAECDFLEEHGVRPGASLMVLAMAANSMLLKVGEVQISLAGTLADSIMVEPENFE